MGTTHAELTTQEKELSRRQANVEALQREVETLTVKIDHTLADLDCEMQKRRLAEVSGARQKVRIATHMHTHVYNTHVHTLYHTLHFKNNNIINHVVELTRKRPKN